MTEHDLSRFSTTLKQTSLDNHDSDTETYITNSSLAVINFDDVKNDYIKGLRVSKPPSSNDALYKDDNTDEYYFIEFKAGGIDPIKNVELKFKIYDSLLILLDILNKTIAYSRNKINYILVYDINKKHRSQHFELTTDSKSKRYIQNYLSAKGHAEFIRFDLEKFRHIYFKNVHTYTFEEFEQNFVRKFDLSP